jgi:hypothetical protein
MAAIVWTDVTTIVPSLSTVSVGAQTLYLAMVNEAVDIRLFAEGEDDARLKLARIYLAAHYATSGVVGGATGGLGASGPVTGESAGTLSRNYGSSGFTGGGGGVAGALDTTEWGRLYRLITQPMNGPIVI